MELKRRRNRKDNEAKRTTKRMKRRDEENQYPIGRDGNNRRSGIRSHISLHEPVRIHAV